MEILSNDNEEVYYLNNNSNKCTNGNYLLSKYSNFFQNKEMYDLQNNIIIEIEIIYSDKSPEKAITESK